MMVLFRKLAGDRSLCVRRSEKIVQYQEPDWSVLHKGYTSKQKALSRDMWFVSPTDPQDRLTVTAYVDVYV